MIGKIIVAVNAALLGAMLFPSAPDMPVMLAALGLLAGVSGFLLWTVARAYALFMERELLLGTAGFGLITLGYVSSLVSIAAGVTWVGAEVGVNVLIAAGYATVTIAWGLRA